MAETPSRPHIDLNTISEEELLHLRVCDLPLAVEGTWLADCVDQLYQELDERGLACKPVCYLADEWLTPQHEPVIGIPFYLAHPALIKLEKKMMLEAEGDSPEACMKLLRHEAGHALSYAYRLVHTKAWRRVFGSPHETYADTYRFRPYSRNYVRHLDGFYAQYHPEEDFVETFAVWLTPGLDWRKHYAGWGALQKLQYVDDLMASLRGRPPKVAQGRQLWHHRKMRITLQNFYKKKRRVHAEAFPDFHDDNLRRLFPAGAAGEKGASAADLLRRTRRGLLSDVALWTGERKYVIDDLLRTLQERCRALQLTVPSDEAAVAARLAVYITTLVMNYRYTGRYRGEHDTK